VLVAFKFFAPVTGHLRIMASDTPSIKKHGGGKVTQVMNPEILDFCQVPNSPKPLTNVPGMRLLKLLHLLVTDVRSSRKEIFMLPVAWELP
jgi:hypothetical protein